MDTTTGSYFWFVAAACVGGIIVFVGILLEVLADKQWFKNVRDLRFWQSAKLWGERIVLFGILIEVFAAGFAAKDEWQTRQEAIKNSPLNQPVSDVFLIANFMLKTNSFFVPNSIGLDMGTSAFLMENKTPFTISLGSFGLLVSAGGEMSTQSDSSGSHPRLTIKFIPINITGPIQNGVVIRTRSPLTVGDVARRIRVIRFSSNLFQTNSEIIGDSAQLFVNGKDIGVFKISPQKAQFDAGAGNQFVIWATNSAPTE